MLVACCLLPITAPRVQAQIMSNNNYIIRMQEFDTASGVTTGKDYNLRSTLGGYNQASSTGINFRVETGNENLTSAPPFSILLSSNIVDFGILSPTNPVIRTVDLSVNSLTVYGYSVIVSENQPLTAIPPADKIFIPDTTCDNGGCGTENASEWTNALTYGFGYRCDNVAGVNCDSSFVAKANLYRRFPNIQSNDDPQSIMAGVGSANKQTRISYKVNTSGAQNQSTYSNVITYVGVPNF